MSGASTSQPSPRRGNLSLNRAREGTRNLLTEKVPWRRTDPTTSPGGTHHDLAALADAGVPLATIAPRFPGRLKNKGVDYVGDLASSSRELEQDMDVVRHAVKVVGTSCRAPRSACTPAEISLNLTRPVHSADDVENGLGLPHMKTAAPRGSGVSGWPSRAGSLASVRRLRRSTPIARGTLAPIRRSHRHRRRIVPHRIDEGQR